MECKTNHPTIYKILIFLSRSHRDSSSLIAVLLPDSSFRNGLEKKLQAVWVIKCNIFHTPFNMLKFTEVLQEWGHKRQITRACEKTTTSQFKEEERHIYNMLPLQMYRGTRVVICRDLMLFTSFIGWTAPVFSGHLEQRSKHMPMTSAPRRQVTYFSVVWLSSAQIRTFGAYSLIRGTFSHIEMAT